VSDATEIAVQAFGVSFTKRELERFHDVLAQGFSEQAEKLLLLCSAHGVDPRRTVMIAPARELGKFLAVSAHSMNVEKLLRSIRQGPQKLEVEFEQAPLIQGSEEPTLPEPVETAASTVETPSLSSVDPKGTKR
jgi:hypothetical protein